MRKELMFRRVGVVAVFVLSVVFISGCGSVPKKFKEEVYGIKSRVETLETKVEGVEAKQSEVERVTSEQAQKIDELKVVRQAPLSTNISVKARPGKSKAHIKDIQTCLKNAGFYDGKIDGIKGKGTRRAIKEFQKANGLIADGVVGSRTWEILSKYETGSARASMGSEEGATK
ncbi:MAG: peptidoglycan-binding domain-containing protein [Candidatus Omnitrophota bacterium]